VPFRRFLCCPKCGYLFALKEVAENPVFRWKYNPGEPEQAFCATCPACKVGARL
jgi:hypothetical protein